MKKKAVEYRLTATKQDFEIAKIMTSEDAQKFARNFYHEDIMIYESVFIIMLNRAYNVTGYAKISQGGICNTFVDATIVAKFAVDSLAKAVIMVHNHPSGTIAPSMEDISISKKVKQGLELFNIQFLDSIIITEEDYYSLSDNGYI